MGFGGGGGAQLTNHVHDNTPLQGGPLNFNNTTIAGMNAGDITFSDGAALQTLIYPAVPAGETLTAAVASTAPTWAASAAATPPFELVDTQVLGGTATFIDSTFTTISGTDVSQLQIVLDVQRNNLATCDILLQYGTGGGLVAGAYYTTLIQVSNAANTVYSNQPEWLLARDPSYQHFGSITQLYVADPTLTTGSAYTVMLANSTSAGPQGYIAAGTNDNILTTCDQIRVSVSAGNFEQGSKMSVYRLNRT
jgi:hypothetical protein